MDKYKNLKTYLDDLASKKPAPGGGSAAALVGAAGCALLSMAANFTIGKEKYKQVEQEVSDILQRSEELREDFAKLCSEDIQAYKKLSAALKLPKDEPQECSKKIQQALREAAAVPLAICKDAYEALKLSLPLAQKGNTNLITDVACAGLMLACAFQSALLNVEINLKSIKDEQFILGVREVLEPLEQEIAGLNQEVNKQVRIYLTKQ